MTTNTMTTATWQLDLASHTDNEEIRGEQNQLFRPIASEGLCGATGLSSGRVRMPIGAQAIPHHHDEDRTVVVLGGTAATLLAPPGSDGWETAVVTGAGDVLYIPAGWIHQAVNIDGSECAAIEISADPVFNHSVHRLPDMARQDLVILLRQAYAAGRLPLGAHPA